MSMTLDRAFKVLGLTKTASLESIELAWRRLRTKLHPDRGGTSEAFDRAVKAYGAAKAYAEAAPCSRCQGLKKVANSARGGFVSVMIPCPLCQGVGA